WITRETLVERVEASADAERSGAIATFTGRVRARDAPDDDRTTHLAFEKYEGVAEARMDDIAAELTERDGVFDVRMHHRTGVIEAGEDIVFVVVLAGHRREAFRTVEDGIDRLKDEVPIFKKEATESETFWVHRRD
ncbi:MAG: molybdopterin synthase, partial [Halorubrum sp.]